MRDEAKLEDTQKKQKEKKAKKKEDEEDVPPGQKERREAEDQEYCAEEESHTLCCPKCRNIGRSEDECFLATQEKGKWVSVPTREVSNRQGKLQETTSGERKGKETRESYTGDIRMGNDGLAERKRKGRET